MTVLRIIAAIVCYLVGVVLVAAATLAVVLSEGTNGEMQQRAIAAAYVAVALLLWVAAGLLTRQPMFSARRMIVLVAIGFVSVAAGMNLIAASSRSHSKRTMADIRSIAAAVAAYETDHARYPDAATLDQLRPQLQPTYIRDFPSTDGWGFPLRYEKSGNQSWIGSPAKYGKWQRRGSPTTRRA